VNRSVVMAVLAASLIVAATPVWPAAGDGHVSLSYQYISVDGFEGTSGKFDIGTVDTHSINVEVDYALSDRWSVSAGIPWVARRYRGGFPHQPANLQPPRDDEFIDDGDYNTGFQDFHLGSSYRLTDGRFQVEPFMRYGVPSHDYPFFGHAALGQNLWHLELGTHLEYFPGLSDFFYRASPSYVFVEETLGQSIDHWRLNLEAGYFLRANLAARAFVLAKQGDGLEFPDDFPLPRSGELWYQHDRLVQHNFVNVGAGLDWGISRDRQASFSIMTMVHADQVHIVEYAVTLAISQAF